MKKKNQIKKLKIKTKQYNIINIKLININKKQIS